MFVKRRTNSPTQGFNASKLARFRPDHVHHRLSRLVLRTNQADRLLEIQRLCSIKVDILPLEYFVRRWSVNLKHSRGLTKAMSVLGVA